MSTEEPQTPSEPKIVTGQSARRTASILDIGNIIAIIFVPLVIIWFGASMLVYAMNRHHPNPKVGHYTQWAAYRFYGVTGFFTAAATFIPGGGWEYYLIAWALAAIVIIPWSIMDLLKIRKDTWEDVVVEEEEHGLFH